MIQGYFRTANLVSCLQRLQNQYGLVSVDTDGPVNWNDFALAEDAKGKWNSDLWPKCMGDSFGTRLEQDEQNGDFLFNIYLTQEQVDSLPKVDNPNFTFQYEGELTDPQDPESAPLPLPTFKVENYDADGLPLGTYRDQTICIQR